LDTVTSTVPEPVGAVAVMLLSLFTVNVAATPLKFTALVLVKPVPVTTTELPLNPVFGLTAVTVGGAGMVYVNWSAALVVLVPATVVTVISTV
jgi:hypothetical protein